MKVFIKVGFVLLIFLSHSVKSQLGVLGRIDHIIPWSSDNRGNITITHLNGASPYTYTWNPGGLSVKDYTDISIGSYTFQSRDRGGILGTYYYKLGYKSRWIDMFGSIFRNDSLIENGITSGNVTALSKNTLPANTNGWFQIVLENFTYPYAIGFLDSTSASNNYSHEDMDFAFHESTNRAIYTWYGGYWTYLGTGATGDVIQVERDGNSYNLYKNNVKIASTATNGSKKNKVKVILDTQPLCNIGMSFNDSSAISKPRQIIPFIDHVSIYNNDVSGNINITKIDGGQPPYSYTWTPGNTNLKDLTNASRNSYRLKISDNNGDTLGRSYSLGYKTFWKNFYGLTFSNDSLKTDLQAGYGDRTAISVNELRPGTDGWFEYIVPEYTRPMMMAFLDTQTVQNGPTDMDFGFHLSTNNAFYAWNVNNWYYISSANVGDVIRVERIGSTFYLKRNNATVYTATAITNKSLKIKGQINAGAGVASALARTGASFADSTSTLPLTAKARVDHIKTDGEDLSGNICLKVFGGTSPYTYTWSPGNYNARDRIAVAAGTYTVKIKDFNNTQLTYTYSLGYKSKWTDHYQTAVLNDSIYATVSGTANKSAISINKLEPNNNGWIEYVLPKYRGPYMIGFLDSIYPNHENSHLDIDFAMHENNGYFHVWANGYWTLLTTVKEGDVIKLEKTGSTFNLKKNAINIFSQSANSGKAYYLKALLNEVPLTNIGCSFGGPLTFSVTQVDPNCDTSNLGSIKINVSEGIAPISYTWNTGGNTSQITSLPSGVYSATVTDGALQKVVKLFNLTNCPSWSATDSLTTISKINNGEIRKIGSSGWQFSYLEGLTPFYPEDTSRWISFKIRDTISNFLIGFGSTLSDTLNFGAFNKAQILNSSLIVREADNDGFTNDIRVASIRQNDVVKILYDSSGIHYYINENKVYESNLFSLVPLKLEAHIYSSGSTIDNIRVSHN